MTAQQLRAWMRRYGYTLDALAAALDLSRRQLAYYRSGQQVIPRVVSLALQALTRSRA
jgi:transcriptional regulator with XRE-family HTH domain